MERVRRAVSNEITINPSAQIVMTFYMEMNS